jgi:hypothetical protein
MLYQTNNYSILSYFLLFLLLWYVRIGECGLVQSDNEEWIISSHKSVFRFLRTYQSDNIDEIWSPDIKHFTENLPKTLNLINWLN